MNLKTLFVDFNQEFQNSDRQINKSTKNQINKKLSFAAPNHS
jgi:hypothetical protein